MPKPPEPGLPWVLCRIGHPVQTVGRTGGLFIGGEPLELSKSTIIEWIDPSTLRPHPVNVEIYGDDDAVAHRPGDRPTNKPPDRYKVIRVESAPGKVAALVSGKCPHTAR
ncbi:hypothetical protein LCGC14_2801690, partial [marine sediment metagenome]